MTDVDIDEADKLSTSTRYSTITSCLTFHVIFAVKVHLNIMMMILHFLFMNVSPQNADGYIHLSKY